MGRGRLAGGLVCCTLLAACGGGNTLSGTFAETYYDTPGSHASCARQEAGTIWKVRIAADTVTVGTTAVQWAGTPRGGACVASWSMGVPGASKAYQVTLVAVCGDGSSESIQSLAVQPSSAGNPVRLADGPAGGTNC